MRHVIRGTVLLVAAGLWAPSLSRAQSASAPQPTIAPAAPPAQAPPAVQRARCKLTVAQALPDPGPPDPRLDSLKPLLAKPQFAAWKSFKLVLEKAEVLRPGSSATHPLPEGHKVTLTYWGPGGADGKKLIATVQVESPKTQHKTEHTLTPGKLLLGVDTFGKMALVSALKCSVQK